MSARGASGAGQGPAADGDGTQASPLTAASAAALLRRPDLWPVAVVVGLHLAAPGWWRRWPPRPWPTAAYRRFRTETMYGHGAGTVRAGDLVGYLEWCRRQPGRRG